MDHLLGDAALAESVATWGRQRVADGLRAIQGRLRTRLGAGEPPPVEIESAEWYAKQVDGHLTAAARPSLRRVLNATGVILHTNLGRAPLAAAARAAVESVAGYAALEVDLEGGGRGSRHEHCVGLLRALTGAEGALVVNNNAAALVLAVNTLAAGREVVVSRGELVEIGGSFRVAEIIARSGARLREVGSTNRTHERDFVEGIGPDTGAVLRVHRSNFRVEGFTSDVEPARLAALARKAGVPLVNDTGSGLLLQLDLPGASSEPTARQALEAGADVVTMSGDKLLGGPQAGIILGSADLVAAMQANPLCRALRPDKLTLAALEATLDLYRDPERARAAVPVLVMLGASGEVLAARAERMAAALRDGGLDATVAEDASTVGGGALPGVELPTTVVSIAAPTGAEALARRLRTGDPCVVARVREGRLLVDPRTLREDEDEDVVRAVVAAAAGPEAVDG